MVRVGFDYLPAASHAPGVGRYGRELVRALAALPGGPSLALLDVGGQERVLPKEALGLEGAAVQLRRRSWRLPRRLADPLLGLVGVERLIGPVDLFQRMAPGVPPGVKAPTLLAVSALPKAGSAAEVPTRERFARESHLLAFSDHTRGELIERFALPPERVHRVPVGADHWQRDLALAGQVPAPDDPPLVLVLGALRAARHPVRVLEAFEVLLERGLAGRLVFAGGPGDGREALQSRLHFSSAKAAFTWVPQPTEPELARWVARAALLVHLSEDEATPVTPLEALAAGTACAVSDLPTFREVLGDHVTYVPTPLNVRQRKELPDQLAAALADALDPAARARRRRLAEPFTWAASARAHADLYRSLCGEIP